MQCLNAELPLREFQVAHADLSSLEGEPREPPSLRGASDRSNDLWSLAQSILSGKEVAPEQSDYEACSSWTSPAELYARFYHKLDAWHYSGLALRDSPACLARAFG